MEARCCSVVSDNSFCRLCRIADSTRANGRYLFAFSGAGGVDVPLDAGLLFPLPLYDEGVGCFGVGYSHEAL